MGPRDPQVLLRAAQLYYVENRSQAAIAVDLGVSRSSVSRILADAQRHGIVEIRLHDPSGREAGLEQELARRFGLLDVRVAAGGDPGGQPVGAVASLAAQLLLESLEDGMVAALSWGKMLQATVEAVGFENERDVTLVQLLGGVSVLSNGASGEELVRALALRLRADYRLLHAPAAMTSAAARGALVGEASISEVIDLARSADVALVGVGDPHRGSSAAVIDAMALAPDDRAGFWEQRPVGDVAGRFFDAGGCPVTGPVDDRVVAVSLEDLRRTPLVAGVVSGRPKTDAVLGALRGGHLDALVCDAALARGLLAASADRN